MKENKRKFLNESKSTEFRNKFVKSNKNKNKDVDSEVLERLC